MRDHPHDISEHRGAHLHIPPPIDTKAQRCSAHWSPESRCNSLRRHWSDSWGGGRGLSLIGRGHFCTSGRPIGGRSRLRYRWVWPDRPLSPHCQWRSFWPSQPLHLLKTQWDGRSLQPDRLQHLPFSWRVYLSPQFVDTRSLTICCMCLCQLPRLFLIKLFLIDSIWSKACSGTSRNISWGAGGWGHLAQGWLQEATNPSPMGTKSRLGTVP
jgi:hypothetical protein